MELSIGTHSQHFKDLVAMVMACKLITTIHNFYDLRSQQDEYFLT